MHLLNHLFLIKVGLINKKYDSNAVKLAFESYFIAFSRVLSGSNNSFYSVTTSFVRARSRTSLIVET